MGKGNGLRKTVRDSKEAGTEELRRRELAIQEATSQAILSVDREGRIVMANLMAEKMFGYRREQLLGLNLEVLLPDRFRASHAAHRAEYFASPRNRPMGAGLDLTGRRQDGSEFPVAVSLNYVQTKDGTLALGLITDLTERRTAEESLQRSLERLELAEEAAGIGVWDWDIQAGKTYCSPKWGPLYGLPSSDIALPPQEWEGLIHPGDRERVLEDLNRALQGLQPYDTEFRVIWPDGTIHWLSGRGKVFRDPAGTPSRMLGVNLDITRRNRAEQERQQLDARLATAQEDERWRISRELHDDLTQPLAMVAMDLGRLVAEPPASANQLKKQLRGLQGRVVQAAEVARHAAHELHPSELDDLGLAKALRFLCESFGQREGITVRFTERRLPGALTRDIAACLYKITQECLRNVAKHAAAKRVTVSVEGAAGGIRLRVGDNGSGFPVQLLGANVGLGILGMRERTRLLKGTFTIESRPGRGTRVTVKLPVAEAEQ